MDYQPVLDGISRLNFAEPIYSRKKYIVIHHSLTEDDQTINWKAIKRFHTSWRIGGDIVTEVEAQKAKAKGIIVEAPWVDIGYNFGIENIKNITTLEVGRSLSIPGAHTEGFNTNGIGVCAIGNFQKTKPPKDIFYLTALTCMYLRKVWYDKLGINLQVIGHRESFVLLNKPIKKDCPGSAWDMQLFRYLVWGRKDINELYPT